MAPKTRVAVSSTPRQVAGLTSSLQDSKHVDLVRIPTITAPLAQNPEQQATVIALEVTAIAPTRKITRHKENHFGLQVMRQRAAYCDSDRLSPQGGRL